MSASSTEMCQHVSVAGTTTLDREWYDMCNCNYSAILATLQITSYVH